jgi:GntR family histidine utilization transcriptional repressor
MKQYDCSRMTINRALATLVERGLIERRKRAGSFVLAPKFHRAVFELPDLRAHIISQGKTYDFDLLEREVRPANARDRSQLGIEGGDVLQIKCVHYVDGKPFALEHRIINLALVPAAETADFDRDPPNSWLFAHVPWSDARHEISAVNADPAMARDLAIRDNAACLMIERWTWRAAEQHTAEKNTAEKNTYVQMIHPGQNFSIVAQFRP